MLNGSTAEIDLSITNFNYFGLVFNGNNHNVIVMSWNVTTKFERVFILTNESVVWPNASSGSLNTNISSNPTKTLVTSDFTKTQAGSPTYNYAFDKTENVNNSVIKVTGVLPDNKIISLFSEDIIFYNLVVDISVSGLVNSTIAGLQARAK